MLKKYRHIIWDWNGTLVDDVQVCVDIINVILAKRSMPVVSRDEYMEKFDFPVIDFYRRVGFDLSIVPFETLAEEYIGEYKKRQFTCRLYDGVVEVLGACVDSGLTQSILSAYQQDRLEEVVEFFQVHRFFSGIFGLNDHYSACKIASGKRLLKKIDIDSRDVLLVGDTRNDFEVAEAIGVDCVLISNGHHKRERLLLCGTDVLNSIEEVLPLLS